MNTFKMNDAIMERQMNFYCLMYQHLNEFLRNFLMNCLLDIRSLVISNINIFINKLHIIHTDLIHFKKCDIKAAIQSLYPSMVWRASMALELIQGLEGTIDMGLNEDEMKWLLNDVCVNM